MKLKKIFVMKTRPGISDQEIHSMMDFDKVLHEHRNARKKNNFIRFGAVGGALMLGVAVFWYFLKPGEMPRPIVQQAIDSVGVEIIEQEPIVSTPQPAESKKQIQKETPKEEISKESPPVTESIQTYAEAEPVNGYPNLYEYFQKELKYPVAALKDSTEGIVSVSFVINKDGKPEQVKILNSLGEAFDNEAIRVINGMPGWKAALLNGKPVPARISMPLTFQIERNPKQQ